jgi:hypothetical protein
MSFVTFPSMNEKKNQTCNVSFKLYILMNQHLLFLFSWVLQKNDQRDDNKS